MKLTVGTVLALGVALVALVLAVAGEMAVVVAGMFIALAAARLLP